MQRTYLPEGCSETDVTDRLFTKEHFNQLIELIGGRKVIRIETQQKIPTRRIDIVGVTDKGSKWVLEHQDAKGVLDQYHMDKSSGYASGLIQEGDKVEGVLVLVKTASPHFLNQAKLDREIFENKPIKHSRFNFHIIDSGWLADGTYDPKLIDDSFEPQKIIESDSINQSSFKSLLNIEGQGWLPYFRRIDPPTKGNHFSETLRMTHPSIDNNFELYVHKPNDTLIGIHCYDFKPGQDEFLDKVKTFLPDEWNRHRKNKPLAKTRRTIELKFDKTPTDYEIWINMENLKQAIQKALTFA